MSLLAIRKPEMSLAVGSETMRRVTTVCDVRVFLLSQPD